MPDTAEELVGPLARGLDVLRLLATAPQPRVRASDLVRGTGLARSTVDRIAATLVRLGHLRAEDRDLLLTPRLLELGEAYFGASGLADTLAPLAERLADELDESVSLAVPDGDGARFITQATRRRTMSLAFRIGDLLPAERCAPGALFAAQWDEEQRTAWLVRRQKDPLDERFPALPRRSAVPDPAVVEAEFGARTAAARETGLALDDQLIEPGLVAVAVPVRDPEGAVLAGLSVVSHTSRHSALELREHALASLRRTADAMEAALRAPAQEPGGSRGFSRYDPQDKAELGPEYLQSLARGLAVLSALGRSRGGLTLSAAAEAVQLPRATARRSLLTLEHLGYVGLDPVTRRFAPLPRVLDLGYARLSALSLPEIVQPHLVQLTREANESASVAVLDGDDIRYVARVPTHRIMSVNITVGTRFPAHATSMGRVLLAGLEAGARSERLHRAPLAALTRFTITDPARLATVLDEVAESGHALVDQELEEGLRSLAVPLHDRDGRVAAAVNISLNAGRYTPAEARRTLLPPLRRTAAAIEADLTLVSRRSPLRMA
jgi:IclR family pca regulon transcriptional regulator